MSASQKYSVSPALDAGVKKESGKSQDPEKSQEVGVNKACCNSDAKWTVLRFVGLCFIAILILMIVYGIKKGDTSKDKRSLDSVYAVGDPIFARDLWLVIEFPSDGRGRRTKLGRRLARHVCKAVRAGQAIGWTPLVVGGRSTCCRSSRCRHLHPSDIPKMNHTSSMHFWENADDVTSALRTAAFLAAIKRGAHFIYHANPEVYLRAEVSPKDYQLELEYQLRKMTLGISVGLVKSNPAEKYVFDPYAHFGPDHAVKKRQEEANESSDRNFDNSEHVTLDEEDIIHKYKICEITPPSMEKFLDTDGFSLDTAAPAITLPGEVAAPFDSRNTLFGRDAFWALLLLPLEHVGGAPSKDNYVIRSIVGQTILAEVAGSTKFSVAKTPVSPHVQELSKFGPQVTSFLDFVQQWTCPSNSALHCLNALISDLVVEGILTEEAAYISDMWVRDLLHVGYDDILSYGKKSTPCIGEDALPNVYFHPAVQYHPPPRSPRILSDDTHPSAATPTSAVTTAAVSPRLLTGARGGGALSTTQLNRQVSAKVLQRLCPTVDVEEATSATSCPTCDRHEDLLVIVTFNRKEYHNIPLFEVIYRHHFQNILYCGEPDQLVDKYMEQYNGIQGTYFSFLPAHSKTGYECLLGAIEMGYNVEGYMIITQDTLINSWNFGSLDPTSIWHGNEHVQDILPDNIGQIDPEGGDKIMKSTQGILSALQFLEEVLLKSPPVESMVEHMHEDERRKKRRRYRRSDSDDLILETLPADSDDVSDDVIREQQRPLPATGEEYEYDDEEGETSASGPSGPSGPSGGEVGDSMASLTENQTSLTLDKKNWHISLFGEIIKDSEEEAEALLESLSEETLSILEKINATKAYRNVTELLFHPANFVHENQLNSFQTDDHSHSSQKEDHSHMVQHFEHMMVDIHSAYKSISEKLNFWQSLVKSGRRNVGLASKENGGMLKKDLEQFQCDISTNSEICHLVADFFQVLERNEGPNFRLFFDDLPIYYVPAKYKDKLYLMANLFTKYHVADELAFPLLLRGLSETPEWIDLIRAEMVNATETPKIDRPEDLLALSEELEQRNRELKELEDAHYIYPIDTSTILRNEAMRNVICRNF